MEQKSVLMWTEDIKRNIQLKTSDTVKNKCFSPKLSLMNTNILLNSTASPP